MQDMRYELGFSGPRPEFSPFHDSLSGFDFVMVETASTTIKKKSNPRNKLSISLST